MKFVRKKTELGFEYIEFFDCDGYECSIQENNRFTKTEYNIWLGIDGIGEKRLGMRMNLNQDHAKKLIKHLQKFVDSGHL